MGILNLEYEMDLVEGKYKHLCLAASQFQSFNSGMLGLGEISKQGERMDALAAIFDLEGFTSFCNQTDPHLVVPEYLDQFLRWLFFEIAENFKMEVREDKVIMWGKFPVFAKFLGDGILFLWNTNGLGQASLGNIVINLYKTCRSYANDFMPETKKEFAKVPAKLRCGIARGEVVPIGGGRDFVGSCINMAARLQKISQLSFAFPRKGFNPNECFGKTWKARFMARKISIRGVDEDELIFVCKEEFEALPEQERQFLKEP